MQLFEFPISSYVGRLWIDSAFQGSSEGHFSTSLFNGYPLESKRMK